METSISQSKIPEQSIQPAYEPPIFSVSTEIYPTSYTISQHIHQQRSKAALFKLIFKPSITPLQLAFELSIYIQCQHKIIYQNPIPEQSISNIYEASHFSLHQNITIKHIHQLTSKESNLLQVLYISKTNLQSPFNIHRYQLAFQLSICYKIIITFSNTTLPNHTTERLSKTQPIQ